LFTFTHGQYISAGTTANFPAIFQGRCLDRAQNQPYFAQFKFNCTLIWNAFAGMFTGVDPTTVNETSYQPFLQAAWHPIPTNLNLFWTGTTYVNVRPDQPTALIRDVVHDYSLNANRYFTLEDTMWGNLLNGLTWCGADDQSEDIWNYTTCPSYGSPGSTAAFWNAGSTQFASLGKGNLQMLGYASSSNTTACVTSSGVAVNITIPQTVTVSCSGGGLISGISFLSLVSLLNTNCSTRSMMDSCVNGDVLAAANECLGQTSCNITASSSQFTNTLTNCTIASDLNLLQNVLTVNYVCDTPRFIYRNLSYSSPSVFYMVEMPNLNATNINTFTMLIITNPKWPAESCGQGTVAQMAYDLQFRTPGPHLNASQILCINDYDAVQHLECVDNPMSPICLLNAESSSSSDLTNTEVGIIGGVIGAAVGGIACFLLAYCACRGKSELEERLVDK